MRENTTKNVPANPDLSFYLSLQEAPALLAEDPVVVSRHQVRLEDTVEVHFDAIAEVYLVSRCIGEHSAILFHPVLHVSLQRTSLQLIEGVFDIEILGSILNRLLNNIGNARIVGHLCTETHSKHSILTNIVRYDRQDLHS